MAVSNHTIIARMLDELQPLQDGTPSNTELQKSIGNVKLMCELLLDGATRNGEADAKDPLSHHSASHEEMLRMLQQEPEITAEEYNVMMKGNAPSDKQEHNIRRKIPRSDNQTEHNEANGESIFDF